jgi:hypothetical protein
VLHCRREKLYYQKWPNKGLCDGVLVAAARLRFRRHVAITARR